MWELVAGVAILTVVLTICLSLILILLAAVMRESSAVLRSLVSSPEPPPTSQASGQEALSQAFFRAPWDDWADQENEPWIPPES